MPNSTADDYLRLSARNNEKSDFSSTSNIYLPSNFYANQMNPSQTYFSMRLKNCYSNLHSCQAFLYCALIMHFKIRR